ncbi:MAG: hypothetical protein AABN34_28400 [Acidobacteriota bacterium]
MTNNAALAHEIDTVSYPKWVKRPKVPMAPETEQRLKELARLLSDEERQVTPMQVAAQILEDVTASYIPHRPAVKRPR